MVNRWLEFWKEKNAFDEFLVVNFSYFLKKVEKYIQPTANDNVLDIGSGPGSLEDAWYNRVKEIHGVDISERYNILAREKHQSHSNVFFYDLPANDYTNLAPLQHKKFNIIIVVGVLHYYRDKQEIIQLLTNIKQIAATGSVLLLADLIVKNSFLKEIVEVLSGALREGKFFSTVFLFIRLRFSSYYKVKKQTGFLVLTEEEWMEILKQLELKWKFTEEPLTLQKNRKNIVIRF